MREKVQIFLANYFYPVCPGKNSIREKTYSIRGKISKSILLINIYPVYPGKNSIREINNFYSQKVKFYSQKTYSISLLIEILNFFTEIKRYITHNHYFLMTFFLISDEYFYPVYPGKNHRHRN